MQPKNFISAFVIILFLSLPAPAKAHDATCDWADVTTLIGCLHNSKHVINDIWGKVVDTWEGVVEGAKGTLFGTVKEIDQFLKGVEGSFNIAKNEFDTITGTMINSVDLGIATVQPIVEDEFIKAMDFLGDDPGGCGPGSICYGFRGDMKDFLLALDELALSLADFYEVIPPASPLNQLGMLLDAVDYMPGYFLYPLYRGLEEMNFSFPYYSGQVEDLTAAVLVIKQAQLGTAAAPGSPLGVNYYPQTAGFGSPSLKFELPSPDSCGYIHDSRALVDDARRYGYPAAVILKGIAVALILKGKTVQTSTSAAAFGTAGTVIKMDAAQGFGTIFSGVADAALAVLGGITSKVYYCDLMQSQGDTTVEINNHIDLQIDDLNNQLVDHIDGQIADLNSQLEDIREQLDLIRSCLPGNGQGAAGCKYPAK